MIEQKEIDYFWGYDEPGEEEVGVNLIEDGQAVSSAKAGERRNMDDDQIDGETVAPNPQDFEADSKHNLNTMALYPALGGLIRNEKQLESDSPNVPYNKI